MESVEHGASAYICRKRRWHLLRCPKIVLSFMESISNHHGLEVPACPRWQFCFPFQVKVPFELRLNVSDTQFVVVENSTLLDTNAVILKVNWISRVPDQNDISRLCNILEIYHSGPEALIYSWMPCSRQVILFCYMSDICLLFFFFFGRGRGVYVRFSSWVWCVRFDPND